MQLRGGRLVSYDSNSSTEGRGERLAARIQGLPASRVPGPARVGTS